MLRTNQFDEDGDWLNEVEYDLKPGVKTWLSIKTHQYILCDGISISAAKTTWLVNHASKTSLAAAGLEAVGEIAEALSMYSDAIASLLVARKCALRVRCVCVA